MRFIVDAQLPPALARWFLDHGHDAEHVFDLGLNTASDREIWAHAKAKSAVLVTKDEDFVALRQMDAAGPAVIWLRVGNTTRRALLHWFAGSFPGIEQALLAGEKLVEIL